MKSTVKWPVLWVIAAVLQPTTLLAQSTTPDPQVIEQLLELDIDQLLNLEVTSAARKAQTLAETAAAVYVITQDDIRRSGVTNIPEALRLAPGVQVARIGADKWAITIRGFNGRFSNKLLVLMDGRSVYDPLYSGVFWHAQDYVLEDIARIEVIRGPGAALWGANAVNGIINIITKSAEQTQGTLVTTHAGTEDRGGLMVRHGGRWGEDTAYRIYAKGFEQDASITADGQDANDTWRGGQAGFRVDSRLNAREQLTVQGDIRRDESGEFTGVIGFLSPPYNLLRAIDDSSRNYNLLTRYHRQTETTRNTLQIYYDFFENHYDDQVRRWRTFDLDWQQQLLSTGRHDWLWGLGYRWVRDEFEATPSTAVLPAETDLHLFSGFVQDEITLQSDLFLTLGAKLEHHEITGWEFQPSARLLWSIAPTESLWTAVSRAVRTPARSQTGLIANGPVIPPLSPGNPGDLPIQTRYYGNPGVDSEIVIAYEAGWRRQWDARLSTDLALFWNDYDHLSSAAIGAPFPEFEPVPHLVLPLEANNALSGHTYGLEIAADWRPLDDWRLQASYSYLRMNINDSGVSEGSDPRHQFSLLSSMQLSPQTELNLWLRYVDELPTLQIPAYTTLDARLAWSPDPGLTFSLVGQNLLDDRHAEYFSSSLGPVLGEIERSVYLKALWRF
jgi:iron complex outermembrane receptor protein